MVKQVPRDDPRLSKRANEWDNMTLEALRDQVSYTHGMVYDLQASCAGRDGVGGAGCGGA